MKTDFGKSDSFFHDVSTNIYKNSFLNFRNVSLTKIAFQKIIGKVSWKKVCSVFHEQNDFYFR